MSAVCYVWFTLFWQTIVIPHQLCQLWCFSVSICKTHERRYQLNFIWKLSFLVLSCNKLKTISTLQKTQDSMLKEGLPRALKQGLRFVLHRNILCACERMLLVFTHNYFQNKHLSEYLLFDSLFS